MRICSGIVHSCFELLAFMNEQAIALILRALIAVSALITACLFAWSLVHFPFY